jgi:hypothetical protein
MDLSELRPKKRKLVNFTNSGFRRLSDDWKSLGEEQVELQQQGGIDSSMDTPMDYVYEKLPEIEKDGDDEVEQLLDALKPRFKGYQEKQQQLFEKWKDLHEALGWELLCFQAVDYRDGSSQLSPCICSSRLSKKIECINVEGISLKFFRRDVRGNLDA